MHPILIEIGRLKIYSYGAMLALSFWIGIVLAARRAGKRGINPDHIYDMSIVLILAAVVGSRTLYILTHRDDYHSLLDIVALWQGGATFYGGFLLALAGAFVYLRRRRLSFLLVADACAPSIALGFFFTRIGCFLSGCCFGNPTHSIFGVVFPAHSPAGYYCPGIPLHPTQLYDSLYGLVTALALLALDRRRPFTGFTFGLLCILNGAGRYVIDFFRYYEASARISRLMTVSQLISICVVATGILVLVIQSARARRGNRGAAREHVPESSR
ncbi:MAG: prolipoprotein diacylglyceryl transferase [Candidatus Krumholzibacteriaceae bacterium]